MKHKQKKATSQIKVIHLKDVGTDVLKGINVFWEGSFLEAFVQVPELATMYAKVYFINVLGLLAPSIFLERIAISLSPFFSFFIFLLKMVFVILVKYYSRYYSNELCTHAHTVAGKNTNSKSTMKGSHRHQMVNATTDYLLNLFFVMSLYLFLYIAVILPSPYHTWFSILFGSLSFAYETYDPLFSSYGLSTRQRFYMFHNYLAYMFGFGLPIALLSSLCHSFLLRMVFMNIITPLFTIQAINNPLPKRSLKYTLHLLYPPFFMAEHLFSSLSTFISPSSSSSEEFVEKVADDDFFLNNE